MTDDFQEYGADRVHRYYCCDCDKVSSWYDDFKKAERLAKIHMRTNSHMIGIQGTTKEGEEPDLPDLSRNKEDTKQLEL